MRHSTVLGPTLWNVFFDGLLRIGLPLGASLVEFVDDVVLVVVDHTTVGLEQVAKDSLIKIEEWINVNGFQLAYAKIEAIMITRKWAYRQPMIGSHTVEVKRIARYLGVIIDSKQTFAPHLRAVSAAAVGTARALGRLMPNSGGLSAAKRRFLTSTVSNKLMYAAPV